MDDLVSLVARAMSATALTNGAVVALVTAVLVASVAWGWSRARCTVACEAARRANAILVHDGDEMRVSLERVNALLDGANAELGARDANGLKAAAAAVQQAGRLNALQVTCEGLRRDVDDLDQDNRGLRMDLADNVHEAIGLTQQNHRLTLKVAALHERCDRQVGDVATDVASSNGVLGTNVAEVHLEPEVACYVDDPLKLKHAQAAADTWRQLKVMCPSMTTTLATWLLHQVGFPARDPAGSFAGAAAPSPLWAVYVDASAPVTAPSHEGSDGGVPVPSVRLSSTSAGALSA